MVVYDWGGGWALLDAVRLQVVEHTLGRGIRHDLGGAGLAGAVLDEEPERAIRLWGAAEALRQSIGTREAPAAHATHARLMAAAREQLGDAAFEAEWAEGQALSVEQAIALALGQERAPA